MLVESITEDGDRTRFLQRETSEIVCSKKTKKTSEIENRFLLDQIPASTNILVVDTNFITLLNMKKIMKQYAFQVTIYADAEEALAFLTNCKHGINIVMWDFHMPGINGLQALKIIGSEMDLPVVIMSDDDQVDSVMKATIHGACDYLVKPVRAEVIANIWQHIVRKRMMSTPGLTPPVQLDLVHNDGLKQDKDESKIVDQDNSEQSVDKIEEKAAKKPRMAWTGDLEIKFLKAIDIVGGPKKANPKLLLKCLQDMEVKGLTRGNVASHLQKHRISLEENQIAQQMLGNGWPSACRPMPLLAPNNVHSTTSSLMNGGGDYPVQENHEYPNDYLTMNNNQFMNSTLPRLPYFDHLQQQHLQQQQQQYQLSQQLKYVMSNKEPEQASDDITDFELIYPSSPYDPTKEFSVEGYNFNQ